MYTIHAVSRRNGKVFNKIYATVWKRRAILMQHETNWLTITLIQRKWSIQWRYGVGKLQKNYVNFPLKVSDCQLICAMAKLKKTVKQFTSAFKLIQKISLCFWAICAICYPLAMTIFKIIYISRTNIMKINHFTAHIEMEMQKRRKKMQFLHKTQL